MRVFKNLALFALTKADDPNDYDDSAPAPPQIPTTENETSTTTSPTTQIPTTTASEIEDGECMTAELDYFGEKSVTQTGAACRNWADIKPPLRKIDNFQQKHNYCRYKNKSALT
jgi:hypothetical protein